MDVKKQTLRSSLLAIHNIEKQIFSMLLSTYSSNLLSSLTAGNPRSWLNPSQSTAFKRANYDYLSHSLQKVERG